MRFMAKEDEKGRGFKTIVLPHNQARAELKTLVMYMERISERNAINDLLTGQSGIVLHTPKTYFLPTVGCAEFCFDKKLGDPIPLTSKRNLFLAPRAYLAHCNYQTLAVDEDPLVNDVVVYTSLRPKELAATMLELVAKEFNLELAHAVHFGVYLGDGKVRSKFGKGHVFDHSIDNVPDNYGDEGFFVRRDK